MKKFGFFVLAIAIGVGYVLYRPMSVKTAGWKMRLSLMIMDTIFKLGYANEYLGIATFHETVRKFSDNVPFLANVTDVNFSYETIDEVPALVYRPASADVKVARPSLVYFHGGGWVICGPEIYHTLFIDMVRRLNIVVIALNYRKAPEHPYPQPFNDCLNGLIAVAANPSRFGVDPARLIVGGDSAGGNLAAAVVGHISSGGVAEFKGKVAQLVLIYPALQGLDFTLPSYVQNQNEEMLTRDLMLRFWQLYVHGQDTWTAHLRVNNHSSPAARKKAADLIWRFLPGSPKPPAGAGPGDVDASLAMQKATSDVLLSPILFSDEVLKKLPPVYMVSCEFDVLRDEAVAFARRLESLQHDVVHHHYQAYHGVIGFYTAKVHDAFIVLDDLMDHLTAKGMTTD